MAPHTSRDLTLFALHHPLEDELLSGPVLEFVAELQRRFGAQRRALLERRRERQERWEAGERPGPGSGTAEIRQSDWALAPVPQALQDRKVMLTGPLDRGHAQAAWDAGARALIADFKSFRAPTWRNVLEGHAVVRDAVARAQAAIPVPGAAAHHEPTGPTLIVRPRPWHLEEAAIEVAGLPLSASLFDFGLTCFAHAARLLEAGQGPYYALSKVEGQAEARLWREVFEFSEDALSLARGTIKASVVIDTAPAMFEMDEMLWELREHSAGLHFAPAEYACDLLKRLRQDPDLRFVDRSQIGLRAPFLRSALRRVVHTAHRRGTHAVAATAASRMLSGLDDAEVLDALMRDQDDLLMEGFDGTVVAHPRLVAPMLERFDRGIEGPHQIHRSQEPPVSEAELLDLPTGEVSVELLRTQLEEGLVVLASWLESGGDAGLRLQDLASAEMSRTQLWHWVHHPGAVLPDGRALDAELFRAELHQIRTRLHGEARWRRLDDAALLYDRLVTADRLEDFLTVSAARILRDRVELELPSRPRSSGSTRSSWLHGLLPGRRRRAARSMA